MKNYKVGSLYAGVGGICLGFKQAGFKIKWSNEWDKNACITYRNNFNHKHVEGDIWDIDETKLEKIDILCAGFPCQAFSVAGYRKGFKDKRGQHFFRIIDFIEYHKPKVIFLENVKNLKGHDNGNTFKTIKKLLTERGYVVFDEILNSKEVSDIPQNRERIFIVCFRKELIKNKVFKYPKKKKKLKGIKELLDKEYDSKLVYTESFNHFELLKSEMKKEDTIYQWRRQYVRENKSNVCPTLTANMGTGGHNVPLILDKGIIRKLSPKECFRFQGFPKNFNLPSELAKSHLYKQAGNSVTVPVVKEVALEIKKTLENM